MLDTLKFVGSSVAKKDYVPSLTHFRIQDGRILGYNGRIAISSPIDLDLTCSPQAVPFIKAIQTSRDTVQMHLTQGNRLVVKSGAFTAHVACLPEGPNEGFPAIQPEGYFVELAGTSFVDVLAQLEPFISEDASRPWSQGVLLRDMSAFATNNVVVIQKWVGVQFPDLNIPRETIKEVLRIKELPEKIQVGERSITFHYESGRWLRSQMLTNEWPDVVGLLDGNASQNAKSTSLEFFQGLLDLKPFIGEEERVFLPPGRMTTHLEEGLGASIGLDHTEDGGCFNLLHLYLLHSVATSIDFSTYPRPVPFYGSGIRGVIAGMR